MRPSLFVLPLLLLLTACAGPVTMGPQVSNDAVAGERAKQQALVFDRVVQDQARVFSLAYPILGANAEFCGNQIRPTIGLSAWNIHTVARGYQSAANELFGLDDRLIVKTVARKSPAQKAGVESGEIIIAANGQALAGRNAAETLDRIVQDSDQRAVNLTLSRDGAERTVRINPITVCAYPVLLDDDSSEVNAYADGGRVIVSRGMLRFVDNDEELALVLAHEVAHNALTHVDKLQQNAMAGTLGGLVVDSLLAAGGVSTNGQFARVGANIGAMQNSVAFEQEADYVGMYFMARAGYNTAGVADFWRRMAAENSRSITARGSHPTSPERFLAIEQTHAEIQQKKRNGQPLAPNFRQ